MGWLGWMGGWGGWGVLGGWGGGVGLGKKPRVTKTIKVKGEKTEEKVPQQQQQQEQEFTRAKKQVTSFYTNVLHDHAASLLAKNL